MLKSPHKLFPVHINKPIKAEHNLIYENCILFRLYKRRSYNDQLIKKKKKRL